MCTETFQDLGVTEELFRDSIGKDEQKEIHEIC